MRVFWEDEILASSGVGLGCGVGGLGLGFSGVIRSFWLGALGSFG